MVYPLLNYGISCWGSTFNRHLEPLVISQKLCVRIISKAGLIAHTCDLFKGKYLLRFSAIHLYFVSVNC